jgi:hypothetical protein
MSASSAGSEPIAWFVTFADAARADHVRSLHDTEMEAKLKIAECVSYGEVVSTDDMRAVPLYRLPMLTDEEREAIKAGIANCEDITYGGPNDEQAAAVLRRLLERLG